MPDLTFTKVAAGHYATADGTYAVVVDGYERRLDKDADGTEYGMGGEWAAVYSPNGKLREEHNAGENLDWFPTKREAVEACQRHHLRSA